MPNCKERQFPWLLQTLDSNIEASHAVFNPVEKKFYLLDLPEAQGKMFKGSSHGWVATVEDTHSLNPNRIYLINPLTRARIKLPSRNKFPDVIEYHPDQVDNEYSVFALEEGDAEEFDLRSSEDMNVYFMKKFVMSSDPSSDGCVIAAIYGPHSRLACCKLNDKRWKPLPVKDWRGKTEIGFADVIFHNGKLHALLSTGQVLVFENNGVGPNLYVTQIARHILNSPEAFTQEYLVECSDGSIIIVERYIHFTYSDFHTDEIPHTYGFKVYKVEPINSSCIKLESIGDDVLILGFNTSLSISSRHTPGYKGNHIYFTDSYYSYFGKYTKQEDSDIGVFNLVDGTLQSLPGLKCNPEFLWPPPIWVNMS